MLCVGPVFAHGGAVVRSGTALDALALVPEPHRGGHACGTGSCE